MATRSDERENLTTDSQNADMSYPQQPGYNPAYQNPYPNQQFGNHGQQKQGEGAYFPPPPPPMPHSSMFTQMNVVENGEAGDEKYSFQFNDKTIRAAFIRKVFTLVFIMLSIVTVMAAIPWLHEPTMKAIRYNRILYFGGYGVFLVTYLSLMCCEGTRRKFPMNLIVTTIFTLATGLMTMTICAHHHLDTVLMALGTCAICTLSIVIFASQTKFDLTKHVGVIFIISMVFAVYGLITIFAMLFFKIRMLMIIYSFLGALMMMLYLFLDIQLMMGGRKHELSPEDYIFAAVQIFVDIVQLFWFLLSLFGNSKN